MTPRHLRGRAGISSAEMAKRLGMNAPSLRLLEGTPTTAWKVETLAAYLRGLGLQLELRALDPSGQGREAVLT
jgi:hypothetical protein